MSLKQKVLTGVRWGTGAKLAAQAVSWAITVVVIRLLSPEDYGLMALAGAFVSFLVLFNELGLGAALVQIKDLEEKIIRQAFGLLIIANFLLFLLALLAAPLVGWFFDEQQITPIIRLLSLQFLVMSFGVIPHSLLLRSMDYKKISTVEFASTIGGSVVTLMLALNGWGVWSLAWGSMATIFCRTLFFNFASSSVGFPSFSYKGMGNILSFSGYIAGERLLWFLYSRADVFIIGKLLGNNLLGFYAVAKGLAVLPMNHFTGLINSIAFPAFSSIQDDPRQGGQHFLKAVRLMSFLAFPILWGASAIAPELFPVLLGSKWMPVAVPFQLLCFVVPFLMISSMMSYAVLGMGHPKIHFSITGLASISLIVGFLIGSNWSLDGICLAWVIIYPLIFIFNLSKVAKVFDIKVIEIFLKMVKSFFGASAIWTSIKVSILITNGYNPSINYLPLLVVVGVIVYGGLGIIFYREIWKEVLGLVWR